MEEHSSIPEENLSFLRLNNTFFRNPSYLSSAIEDFYKHGSFSDVSLIFSDGELHSHRIVLSSASSYLRRILIATHEEAIIRLHLPDFSLQEGKELLDRIYGIHESSGFKDEDNNIIPQDMIPLIETLRIHRSHPQEVFKKPPEEDEVSASSSMEEDSDVPLEDLLESTHTVAIRRSREAILACHLCESSWDDQLKLHNHVLIDHNGIVQCGKCDLHFDEYGEYEVHRENHIKDEEEEAQAEINKAAAAKRRKRRKKEEVIKSEPKALPKANEPRTDAYRPTSPGVFKCETCPDKVFESQTILDYHRLQHADRKDSFSCDICDSRFNSEKGLTYHLKKHDGVANFLCDDCGSRFFTRQKLQNHRRSKHTFERPYVCDACGEAFARSDKLIVHIRRAHTGEKPYQCEFCEWRGVDSSSLIHHKKKHGPDKATKTIKRYVHVKNN